jgi:proliferating cell nuclear antigen
MEASNKIFEAEFASASYLKGIIEAIKEVVTQTVFYVGKDGIDMTSMDSAHVALVSLKISMDATISYMAVKNITLGIDIEHLWPVLKTAKNSDNLILAVEEAYVDRLQLSFKNEESGKANFFSMKLIEVDSPSLDIPPVVHQRMLAIPSAKLSTVFHDLLPLGDSLTLRMEDSKLILSVNGPICEGRIELTEAADGTEFKEAGDEEKKKGGAVVEQCFSLRYLYNFSKASNICKGCYLYLSEDMPIMLKYPLGASSYVSYYLAPKISDDEKVVS